MKKMGKKKAAKDGGVKKTKVKGKGMKKGGGGMVKKSGPKKAKGKKGMKKMAKKGAAAKGEIFHLFFHQSKARRNNFRSTGYVVSW